MMAVNREKIPAYKEIRHIDYPFPKQLVLDAGVPLYYFCMDEIHFVRIDLMFEAGTRHGENPFIPQATVQLLQEGSSHANSEQLANQLDSLGSELHFSCDKDYAFISLLTLPENLHASIHLLCQIVSDPSFPEEEVALFATNANHRSSVEMKKVSTRARRKLQEMLFSADHPYGRQVEKEHYEGLSRKQVESFYKQFYTADRLKILVGGEVDDTLLSGLNRLVGDLKCKRTVVSSVLPDVLPAAASTVKIHCPDAVQSAVRIGMPALSRIHPDFIGMNFVNMLLGGFFGSRLMKNIREDKGFTYGIHSVLVSYRDSGYMAVVSEVKSGVEKQVVDEVLREFDRLKNENIAIEEIRLVKNYYLGGLLRGLDGMMNLCDHFRYLILEEMPFDYYQHVVEQSTQLNSAFINHLSNTYLDENTFQIVVAGNLR